MASPTDLRLIAQVELIAQKSTSGFSFVLSLNARSLRPRGTAQIHESLMASLSGQGGLVNSNTLAFVRRANLALDKWWQEFDDLHSE